MNNCCLILSLIATQIEQAQGVPLNAEKAFKDHSGGASLALLHWD
ncbi:MAG: hypothetical protein ACYYK0_01640 [Candidatus Eutrophobiaceae bacterium]